MTIQDLKNNRNEIIENIKEILEENEMNVTNFYIKEVMNRMVSMLGFRFLRSTNVIDLVEEVMDEDFLYKLGEEERRDSIRRMEEIRERGTRELMKHI